MNTRTMEVTTPVYSQMETTELQNRLSVYRFMYINGQAPSGRKLTMLEIMDARWKVTSLENEIARRNQ